MILAPISAMKASVSENPNVAEVSKAVLSIIPGSTEGVAGVNKAVLGAVIAPAGALNVKFAGSELPILTGGVVPTTSSTRFNTTYSRAGVYGAGEAPVYVSLAEEFGAGTEYWVSFLAGTSTSGTSYYDQSFCKVYDDDSNLSLAVTAVNGALTMIVYGDDGTSNSVALTTIPTNSNSYYVFHVEQSGSDVVATAYLNGILDGSVTHAGKTSRGIKTLSVGLGYNRYTPNIVYNAVVSEVIIADGSLIGARFLTIPPTGDGTYTAWNGTYADIDEITPDASAISTDTEDAISTFTHGSITASNIHALIIAGSISSGTNVGLKGVLRIGTTDYLTDFLSGPSSFELPNFAVWAVSPATASTFTDTEVSALEWGFKCTVA